SCINGQFSCDGSNCSRECTAEEFKCVDDGLCVEKKYLCNGIFNCRDGSDEVNCSETRTCSEEEFTCNNGRCVPMAFKCDGHNDCQDFSDEFNCKQCKDTEFMCSLTPLQCIAKQLLCDGHDDCGEGTDEINC
ncbi:hypothetical protein LOTGIDRAFT_68388, partial [Lottia gigantea]